MSSFDMDMGVGHGNLPKHNDTMCVCVPISKNMCISDSYKHILGYYSNMKGGRPIESTIEYLVHVKGGITYSIL